MKSLFGFKASTKKKTNFRFQLSLQRKERNVVLQVAGHAEGRLALMVKHVHQDAHHAGDRLVRESPQKEHN
jgi:hypothetical protein